MNSKGDPKVEKLPATSFRMEDRVLICSGLGMAERRIPMAEVSGWMEITNGEVPEFRLRLKGGGRIVLQDAKGELTNALSAMSDEVFDFDPALKDLGRLHVDERLGKFTYSDGVWLLTAEVDLPFQADVPIGFQLEMPLQKFPESMPKNVIWIQDNLGEIWNDAVRLINAFIEAEGIVTPGSFVLRHLWAEIPEAALEASEWRFIVEIEEMYESFEVVFRGLEPISCNVA